MKKCFKCGQEKERTEFYKHPQMGDGLLGKCKECTKKDTAERELIKSMDPEWVASERKRHREKSLRARLAGKISKCSTSARKRWREKNKHKIKAQARVAQAIRKGVLKRLPCEVCGDPNSHGHHHDYSKPLDVWWLCSKHHGEAHHKENPLVIIRQHETLSRVE